MYKKYLTLNDVQAEGIAVVATNVLRASVLACKHSVQLHCTGGTAVVEIVHLCAGKAWEVLPMDNGNTTVSLSNGGTATVDVQIPVEVIGVRVVSISGSPLITAQAVGAGL